MKKLLIALSSLTMIFSLCGCNQKPKETKLNNCSIHHDDEFGGAYIDISISGFNKLGFAFGDSLDLSFSNGVKYEDIGYYSGYYVAAGQELVVGYPGYDYIKFCINYGEDVYVNNNFDVKTKVTITVNEKGKYLPIEEMLSIKYSDDINEYDDEEQFANFREISMSAVKAKTIYRGASPIDNRRKRASIVDGLLDKYDIALDIDLADTRATINDFYKEESFNSPYFKNLDEDEKVLPLGMGAAYKSDDFSNKLKDMFIGILNNDGPYYIHCLEGKDRTGYVCMVIEAMCGASYEDLIDDYFITYNNYYKIEKNTEKYNLIKEIHIDEMIRYVFSFEKSVNLLTANYKSKVDDYLLAIGLEREQIDTITNKLKA